MRVGTIIKITIGLIGILALGFIAGFMAFEVLTVQSPNIEEKKRTVKPDTRRITTSRFVKPSPRTVAKTPHEEINIESLETETSPVPERVPTAQSSDDEIKEFSAWLSSSLEQEGHY